MDKLKMQTQDGVQRNIDKIAVFFPNCITEKKAANGEIVQAIDFDKLRQELSSEIVEGREERYQFTWPDKKKAILLANSPINATLRPCREESVDFDNTQNLYIEGDNLDVLKCLKETYLGKVKMIYIDPPYNTGNDFVYEDDFAESTSEYLANSGQYDEQANRLVTNTESNGRFHTDWLNMIYPRLKVAKDLLTDDGVIFISIDDNEVENLKKICDEIYGSDNYVNLISLKTKDSSGASGGGEDRRLKKNIEFVLCYAREHFIKFNELYKPIEISKYLAEMEFSNRSFKYTTVFTDLGNKEFVKNVKDGSGKDMKVYKHIGYKTKSIYKIAEEEKINIADVFAKYLDRICTTENAQTSIRTRIKEATKGEDGLFSVEYIPISGRNKEKETTIYFIGEQKRLVSWFNVLCIRDKKFIYKKEKIGTFWDGFNWNNVSREGEVPYPNGKKAVAFVEQLCKAVTKPDSNDIILDFFSGSATTAHAVINCNYLDNGNRHFIMVQLPEKPQKELDLFDFPVKTLCDVGKERIRRAGKKIKEDLTAKQQENGLFPEQEENMKALDIGFRVLKLDSSNMEDIYYSPAEYNQNDLFTRTESVKPDRTSEDLLFQVMLELGATLDSKIEQIEVEGKTIYNVATNYLVACFDNEINDSVVTAIAKMQPQYVVFRDSSMADDSTATNFEQIFKTYSPNTTTKVL